MVPIDAPLAPPALIRVVAGAPGAGKSTVTDLLLRRLREVGAPVPALLDKDTLFGGFVAAVLATGGRPPGEREGSWYDAHVKRHEYDGLTAAAREVAAYGCPVLLGGPFTGRIRDPGAWQDWRRDLGGGPVELIYVRTDPETLVRRLRERGSERDSGKLADLEAFLARMTPQVPPPVPHRLIENGAGAAALEDQVVALVGTGRSTS